MSHKTYFPKGIATGKAFCNRKTERNRLKENIAQGLHTLIMSPRRYGKTSLANYVAEEMGLPYAEVDLFIAIDINKAEKQILKGIKQLIKCVGNSVDQNLNIIREYFKKINAKWTIGTHGIEIALIPDKETDPATNIMEALEALEILLVKKNKRVIFFLDEIQVLSEIAEGQGIEGAIRHVIQKTQNLVVVFSGSNRHLLQTMFFDKTRPLYKLCDKILLDRISKDHYTNHLNAIAKETWQQKLSEETLQQIFLFTDCHPFYINALCLEVWRLSEDNHLPDSKVVQKCWKKLLNDDRLEIIRELSLLSIGQRKVLLTIANGYNIEPTGKTFLRMVDLSASSIIEALKVLEEKDYIQKQTDGMYMFIDPLVRSTLRTHFRDDNNS